MTHISVVTTLYKSEEYIKEFYSRISKEIQKITGEYEIVMVDDGSPDNSLAIALSLLNLDHRLSILELSRNYGHHKAMMTGLEYAKGELIFLIDVDLEEPPELIEQFYSEMKKGNQDVIYGIQAERKGGLIKQLGGKLGWWIIEALLPIAVPVNQSTVRLMTGKYVAQLLRHKEHMTAIGGLWVITGFRQTGIQFFKGNRKQTSYTLRKRMLMLLDSVTSFSERPLYAVFFLGIAIFFFSSLLAGYLIIQKLFGIVLEGWVSVVASVWMLGGVTIFCLGVIGLYISRIFIETKNRPYTIVRDIYSLDEAKNLVVKINRTTP